MILGITGTIGAGKSTVCKILSKKNIPIVSADDIGHKILQKEEVKEILLKTFGNIFNENGQVDRKLLADIAFGSKENLEKLNSITHPLIREEIKKQATELEKTYPIVACEIPLLFESGWTDLCDKILTVYLSKEETVNRLIIRGMTEDDALRRYEIQMSPEEKIRKSHFSVCNDGNFEKLAFKVAQVLDKC